MKKISLGIIVIAIGLVGMATFEAQPSGNSGREVSYKILQKWELPDILEEVSAIAWIEKDRVASVQDEEGSIFIYNLKTSQLEDEIPFAEEGDYEGIAIIKDDAYVLRSDGVIFEIRNFRDANPEVVEYVTRTSELRGINIEGFCADTVNNRLLLAVKERKDLPHEKEIYAFNLSEKDTQKDPLFKVNLSDPILEKVNEELEEKFSPGEIGIHPQTGEYFILDGTRPKLLIVEQDGSPKELIELDHRDFGNPEGLTFSPDGDLYISNEAENAPANILKVSLKERSIMRLPGSANR